VTNVVAPTDFGQRFSRLPSRKSFEHLMAAELELPTKPYPSGLSPLPAFVSPRSDQLPLELSEATKDCQHQPSMSRGSIRPGVRQGSETGPGFADRNEDV
jgi:hypothetical protein